jgi:ABC-type antimicrobial peptide transport system permease subunit
MSLIVAFSLIALVLASVGLYGVLSYAVALRTPEIGLRIALGAERSSVVGAVIRRALVLGGAGIALGWAAAFGLTRVFSSMLFEVSPADPATFVLVGAVLLTVAAAAAFVPARRAASVDPVIALRCD